MIDKIFTILNLKKEHELVYLTLLETGPLPAGNLAKRLNLPRATLYSFLGDLAQKGLVLQSEKQGVKIWQAAPPEKIQNNLSEQVSRLENLEDNFAKFLPQLKARQKTEFIAPRFHYFEGSDGIKHMLKDMLLYRDLESELIWPAKDMMDVLGDEYLIYHNKERIKRNISIKTIWPIDRAVNIKKNIFLGVGDKFKREIRLGPAETDVSMGYWAYGNKVVFVSSKKEGFGFIVESAELRQLMKMQFSFLWKISKPLKAETKYTDKFFEK